MAESIFLRLMCKDALVRDTIERECKTAIADVRYSENDTRVEFLCDRDGIIAIGQAYTDPSGYPYVEFREPYNFNAFLKVYLSPNRNLRYRGYTGNIIRDTALSISDFQPIEQAVEASAAPAKKTPPRICRRKKILRQKKIRHQKTLRHLPSAVLTPFWSLPAL